MIQSTDCFHMVHKECFKKEARIAGINMRKLTCPVCDSQISMREIKEHLTKEVLDEIEEREFQEFVKTNPNLRKCPCGAMMEVQQGEVNLKAKDDNGNEISH